MPKRKTKGVPGRSSLPPGYQHPFHQGYVPWAKPIFQGPMIGPQPGTFYDPRMPGGGSSEPIPNVGPHETFAMVDGRGSLDVT